jgi:hypothetical protein
VTRIELLYLDGCPNHEALYARVRELLSAHDVQATIESVRVTSDAQAEARRFLGSPTLRVDGADVEPGADERTDYGLSCRLFRGGAGLASVPDDAWIVAALEHSAD